MESRQEEEQVRQNDLGGVQDGRLAVEFGPLNVLLGLHPRQGNCKEPTSIDVGFCRPCILSRNSSALLLQGSSVNKWEELSLVNL